MKNAIILASGGLDSTVVAYYVKKKLKIKKIKLLFFDYGQRALKEELFCVKKLAKDLGAGLNVVGLKWLGSISTALLNKKISFPETKPGDLGNIKKEKKGIINWWVPCRNSIFLLNALAFAESEFLSKKDEYDIYIGIKKEGSVPMKDTTPEFLKKMNDIVDQVTHSGNYKFKAPIIEMDKDDVINLGKELRVPFEFTYSCYVGNKFKNNIPVHCGTCNNCRYRQAAFYWSGLKDISIYTKEEKKRKFWR